MHRSLQNLLTLCSMAVTMLLAVSATVLASDDLTYPETPAGQTLQVLLAALNTGDAAVFEQFEATHRSPAELAEQSAADRAQQMLQATGIMGTITALEVLESEPLMCAVLAKAERLPMQLLCRVTLGAESPHYLNNLEILPAPAKKAESTGWAEADWATLEELLTRAIEATGLPGISAVVMEGGVIVDEAAVGVRVVGEDAALTLDDRFHIGSITKSMTATAIARLIEQGTFDWSTTLAEALPDFEMREEYRSVTLEQLLQHRAGFPPGLSDEDLAGQPPLSASADDVAVRARFVAAALATKPLGPAGADSVYSNAGYTVAGHIAERIAGMPWEDVIRREVFEPFALTSGGFGWPHTNGHPDQPRGHTASGDTFVPAPTDYDLGPEFDPAGNVQCTMRDLATYAQIHLNGLKGIDGPLKATTFKRLHTPLVASPNNRDYACGWGVRRNDGVGEVHRHNGSGGTFLANMEIHVDQDRVIVIALNVGFAGREVVSQVVDAIAKKNRH